MVENRTNTARNKSAVTKIRKSKIINSFKREYVVSSAIGKAQYVVSICNVPTCTCRDFQINGERVISKYIIFLLLNVLKLKDETIYRKFGSRRQILQTCLTKHLSKFQANISSQPNQLTARKITKLFYNHIHCFTKNKRSPYKRKRSVRRNVVFVVQF